MRRPFLVLLLLGLLAAPWAPAKAGPFSGLFAFGDSLSDSGNALIATSSGLFPGVPPQPVSPYYAGRFSNGPNWVDQLGAKLGLSVAPSLAGGTNYAVGLATIGPNLVVPGNTVQAQLDLFGLQHPLGAPSTALYTMWAGSNDLLIGLSQVAGGTLTPAALLGSLPGLAQTLVGYLGALDTAGAKNFLVLTLPDLGLTPRLKGTALQGLATLASATFNQNLVADLLGATGLADASVRLLDIFGLYQDAVANPGKYGFTNVSASCLQPTPVDYANPPQPPGGVCASPGTYLSWDDVHPTTATHGIIAAAAFALEVPEPASLALLLVAAGGLVAVRRRA